MCGIAGFHNFRDDTLLRAMTERLRHRGPDSDGFFTAETVGLGMRRLAVIDVDGGAQPVFNEDRSVVAVFNGEIYNHRELRQNLEVRGHRFASKTDTEVLVHLYEEKGPDLVSELNGMFAFALWDAKAKRLLLARDPLGVKPLYIARVNNRLAFASEIKALLALPWISREIDTHALGEYLTRGAIPAPLSIFKAVRKLQPGHRLMIDRNGPREERFWAPPPIDAHWDPADTPARVEKLLDDAVRRQLVSDVPLGLFLSGGLDSSALLAFAQRHVSSPLKTFTIGYEGKDSGYDEMDKARRVARHFGCDHHEFVLSPRIEDLVAPLARCFDEPFADSSAVPTYLVSRESRRHVTVALTGLGGDEMFGGYPRYLGLRLAEKMESLPMPLRRGAAGLAACLPDRGGAVNWLGRAKRYLETSPLPLAEKYRRWMSIVAPERLAELCPAAPVPPLEGPNDASLLAQSDLTGYLPTDLLCLTDRVSMAHGLEARVPFCDIPLVNFMARLPLAEKTAGFNLKRILKQSTKDKLPQFIYGQTKKGFSIPLARWLRGELKPLLDEALSAHQLRRRGLLQPDAVARLREEHDNGRRDHSDALWALLCLEVWHREYVDTAAAPAPVAPDVGTSRTSAGGAGAASRSILIASDIFFPDEPGGSARVPWELARGLARGGHRVQLLAGSSHGGAPEETKDGVRVLRYHRRRDSPAATLLSLRRAAARLRYPVDAAHVHHPFTGAALRALGRLAGLPTLGFFHSPWAEEYLLRKNRQGRGGMAAHAVASVYERLETAALTKADRVVVLSRYMKEKLAGHHPDAAPKAALVPGAVDTERFCPARAPWEAREKLGWPKDKTVLLTVRNLEARMGLENLIDALPDLLHKEPTLRLYIAGEGTLRASLEAQTREKKLTRDVHFLGKVPDDILPLCYQAADVFVLPTRALEGFGLVTVEALASGLPVVATPVGGTPEILAPLDASLLTPGTAPADIAFTLEKFLARRTEWPDMRRRAAEHARRHYSWDRAVDDVVRLTEEILTERRPPSSTSPDGPWRRPQ